MKQLIQNIKEGHLEQEEGLSYSLYVIRYWVEKIS